jgi:hypothetical protein
MPSRSVGMPPNQSFEIVVQKVDPGYFGDPQHLL